MKNKNYYIIAAAIIIAALIMGGFFYQAVNNKSTIKVVGIAKKSFTSDTVKWSLTLSSEVGKNELEQGYRSMKTKLNKFKAEIKAEGIATEQFNIQPITVIKQYNYITKNGNSQRVFTGYELKQYLFLVSKDIDQIENLVLNPLQMYQKDIIIDNSNLQYFYSQIDDLKKEIIANATVNAEERAARMLENTDLKVNKVLAMNSGIFQITEPFSTNTSSMGIYNTSSKNKEISVTAHVTFSIK
jgi:hypothetical protein